MNLPVQTPDTALMSAASSIDNQAEDQESDDSMDQIRAIAMATAKRRLNMADYTMAEHSKIATPSAATSSRESVESDSEISDEGAKIRAIAQQTANRRVMMAEARKNSSTELHKQDPSVVRLEGYTGPDALAKENQRMERIKAKAIQSASRQLGSDLKVVQETIGVKLPTSSMDEGRRKVVVSDASMYSSADADSDGDDESSGLSSTHTEGATNFHDIQDPELKRLANKLLKKLNHDPWDEFKKFSDPDVCEFLQRHPETASILYDFTHFSGYIFPLSMLCTLGASPRTIEEAYKSYKPAIDECDVWIGTPLHYACSYKAKSTVINFLISKNPSMLQKTNQFGRTPLHTACLFKGSTKMVSVLLQKFPRAAVIPEKDGYTPLHLACENGANAEIVKMLANSNPETCLARTKKGSTPLDLANSHNASKSVVEVLEQTGMDLAEKEHELNEIEGKKFVEPDGGDDDVGVQMIVNEIEQPSLRQEEYHESEGDNISDGGADIRAIARETANRRLRMAELGNTENHSNRPSSVVDAVALHGYTGPDALAKQMSRMERIKAKAILSAGRELGANTAALTSTIGIKASPVQQNEYLDESESDSGSEEDSGSDDDSSGEEESSSEDEVDIRAIAIETANRRLRMAEALNQSSDGTLTTSDGAPGGGVRLVGYTGVVDTEHRRLRHEEYHECEGDSISNGGADIRAIARETANRRLRMAEFDPVALHGYTGPDALAKQMSRMERIKAKAILSAGRELGANTAALTSTIGIKASPVQQNEYLDESESDSGSEEDSGSDDDSSGEEESSSEDEVDIRAIAKETANRRLRMAEALNQSSEGTLKTSDGAPEGAVRLVGYTGPDALARETSRMDKIKAKAVLSASRQLGTDRIALEEVIGVKSTPDVEVDNKESSSPPKSDITGLVEALGVSKSFFDASTGQQMNTEESTRGNNPIPPVRKSGSNAPAVVQSGRSFIQTVMEKASSSAAIDSDSEDSS
ncbi:MAG: ankyrin repeat domain-containing protein, partial [Candidatus Planktophila sp.]